MLINAWLAEMKNGETDDQQDVHKVKWREM